MSRRGDGNGEGIALFEGPGQATVGVSAGLVELLQLHRRPIAGSTKTML